VTLAATPASTTRQHALIFPPA